MILIIISAQFVTNAVLTWKFHVSSADVVFSFHHELVVYAVQLEGVLLMNTLQLHRFGSHEDANGIRLPTI